MVLKCKHVDMTKKEQHYQQVEEVERLQVS